MDTERCRVVLNLNQDSNDKCIKDLYNAGMSQEQVFAIVNLIIKILEVGRLI